MTVWKDYAKSFIRLRSSPTHISSEWINDESSLDCMASGSHTQTRQAGSGLS